MSRRACAMCFSGCALALLLQYACAAGASGDLTDLPLERLLQMEVYGASRFQQRAAEAPSPVSVVTRDDIRTFGYRTLGEALGSVRGVFTTYDRNYRYLGVRGFARPGDYNSRVLLLVDGYALNDSIYDTAPIGGEFPIDVDLIERIEFVPGPGSSLKGSNAFFGVINVITRKAADVGTEAAANAESKSGLGLRASIGRRFESGAEYLVSLSRHASRGEDLRFPEFAAINGGLAQGLDYERATRLYARFAGGPLTFSAGVSGREKGIPTGSFGTAFGVPGSFTADDYRFADLRYQSPLDAQSEISARIASRDYLYYGDYIYDVPPLVANRDEARSRSWTLEARLLRRLSAQHRLILGAEHQRDGSREMRNFDREPFASYLDHRSRGSRIGVFAQSEYQIRPDLILNAGLRHDKLSDFSGNTSPRLGLILLPSPQSALKLLTGRAFRAPNAYERFYDIPSGGQKGNTGLDSERIRTYELVYERTHGATRLAANTYYYRIDGLINQIVDPADGLLVFRKLDNATRTRGIEFEAEHRLRSGQHFKGSWARQTARTGSAWLDNSPRNLGKLFASGPLAGGRLRIGTEALYVGRRLGPGGNVPGYTVLNANARLRLADDVELRASIYNLGDRRYADIAPGGHLQSSLLQDGRRSRIELLVRY